MNRAACWILVLSALATVPSLAQDRRSKEEARGSAIEAGIWNGQVTSGDRVYDLRVINDFDYRGSLQSRFEFRDPNGGSPIAVGYGFISGSFLALSNWSYAPSVSAQLKAGWNPQVTLSASNPNLIEVEAQPNFGYSAATLERAPALEALGDIATARDVAGQFEGIYGCHGDRAPMKALRLNLEATSDTQLKGSLEVVALPRQSTAPAENLPVIAQFDATRGTLSVFVEGAPSDVYDFEGRFSDSGRRLAGLAGRGTKCEVVQFYRPGANPLQAISRPTGQPIAAWDTPGACVAMITWANQARRASGNRSLYLGMTVDQADKIAVGLFADTRFRPFFGVAFGELTDSDRSHLGELAEACKRQVGFAHDLMESGAYGAITKFVGGRTRGATSNLPIQKFQLMQTTLAQEIAALKPRAVGEANIAELEATLAGLDSRFGDLWEADKAEARALIESKLEAARGAMAQRLLSDIAALTTDVEAFKQANKIRQEIAALGDSAMSAQAELNAALDAKLSAAADAEMTRLSDIFARETKDLATLKRMRAALELRWPVMGKFAKPEGSGFTAFATIFGAVAAGAFPTFEKIANDLLDESAPYETRQRQYFQIVTLYSTLSPTAPAWVGPMTRYTDLVKSLEPKIEAADLVDVDGSPSAIAIRLATASYLEQYWQTLFSMFPYDLSFIATTVKVAGTAKRSCSPAESGGYWCDFHLTMDSAFPFPEILRNLPSSARFAKEGDGWSIVEVPNNPGTGIGGAGIPESFLVPCQGCYDPWSNEAYLNTFWSMGWLD
ncbi:MAG: hypothetical protein HXY22_01470 [Alphaproteobacteria bacterium]|nr:hypothetical protein [Alphaproteobacteria bacterium]